MGDVFSNYNFIIEVNNYIKKEAPDLDSETTIARSLTKAFEYASKTLGIGEEPLISVDGVLWSYSNERGTWSRLENNELLTLAQAMDGAYTAGDKPKRIKIGFTRAQNIARSTYHLHELQAPDFFELNQKPGTAFTNGFATVSEWGVELEEHSPDHAATVAYDFELETECEPPEKWLAFLNSLFVNDADSQSKIKVLQEFIGAAIAGGGLSTSRQKCLLLLGSGANGKSLLGDLISELLFPKGTATFVSPRRWDRDYSVHSLRDSKINIVGELPETNALDASAFKSIIAGDRIEARLPYQSPYYFSPQAAHIFSANEVPRTNDTSHGFMRRWIMISFNENFENSPFRKTKEDFVKELEPEKSAIIYWALNGAARLIKNGDYSRIESHKETIDDWRKESDGVFDFATSCLEFPSQRQTQLGELRSAYKDWAGRVGRVDEIGAQTLSKRLQKVGLDKKRLAKGAVFNCDIKPISAWQDVSN